MTTTSARFTAAVSAVVSFTQRICPLLLVLAISGCMGWAPGNKAYWDNQVREMCKKDGGVQIFERLRVSSADLQVLGMVGGKIAVPIKQLAHPQAPAYAVIDTIVIREQDPLVRRFVSNIVRRSDGKVIARWVAYSRVGGDFPSPSHETQFTCPELSDIKSQLQRLFIVEEMSK